MISFSLYIFSTYILYIKMYIQLYMYDLKFFKEDLLRYKTNAIKIHIQFNNF